MFNNISSLKKKVLAIALTLSLIALTASMSFGEEINNQKIDVRAESDITGQDRYDTSLNIAKELRQHSAFNEVAVVNGVKGLPDAVSVAGIAAEKGMPILLTNQSDNLNNLTKFLDTQAINNSYVVGGGSQFPGNINSKLPNAVNIAGANRNETNIKIINKFYTNKELKDIYVCKNGSARQADLIDALSVGVLAAILESPVMIVGNSLDANQKSMINSKKFINITKVGGNGNENTFNQLKELVKLK